MWWHHTLGNVKSRPFSQIWQDVSDPLMAGLKARPRPVHGRCGACAHLAICGGNTRVRAQQTTGDAWAEDPGCYLSDEEIGLKEGSAPRTVAAINAGQHRVIPLASQNF
jgi:radical SAM protein with 4Fe4S-binding SPASM domain